jgi:translocation and assembly module TamB
MRIARRLLHVLVIVLTLIVGATAAAIIVTQTAWFKNLLRSYIVREANQYLNGQVSIGRLGGNLFFGVELEDIGVSMDGSPVVAVKDLGLDYNVFELVSKGLSVDNIRLNKPVIYLRREGDSWSISKLVKKQQQEADRSGPARPISIDDIGISDGSIVVDGPVGTSGVDVPKRFDRIDAKLAFKYEPVRYSIEITHVSFRGSDPAIALNALSGGVAVKEDTVFVDKLALRTAETSLSVDGAVQHYLTKPVFKLQVSSDKLSIPEIARLVPALAGVRLQPAFQVKLDGPLDRLGVEMNVESSAGRAYGKFLADVLAPGQSVAGDVSVRHLDLSPIVKDPRQKSDITADAKVDVRAQSFSDLNSLRGTVKLDAPRVAAAGYAAEQVKANARFEGRRVALNASASAYGANATANGRVTIPEGKDPLAFDVSGAVRRFDVRRLPKTLNAPPAETDVNAEYHVAGTPQSMKGDLRFQPSTVAGARIEQGSTAGFSYANTGGAATGLGRRSAEGAKAADVGYDADVTVSNVDLQRIGGAFNVSALESDRYKSDINGHVTASGKGTDPKAMDVTANGTITDSTVMGGRIPNLAFDARLAEDNAHVKANGSFAGFDPAVASGKPATKGTVGGTLDVDATVSGVSSGVTPDTVGGTAKVSLQPSTIGGLAIDRANVDADYSKSTGQIRTFDIAGRDLNVQASGTLALNETGQSNLKVHADSPSLQEIGKIVGTPLTGIVKVDATVTGNRKELKASGNFTGDGVKYGDNGALTLATDFSATVPELHVEDARITAATHATFVTVGGQNINELDAKTDYAAKQISFDATAKQPQRSLSAAGSALLHPDHQEVHLQRLGLTTPAGNWQTPAGIRPAIQYGNNAIAVKDFALVNGDQRIGVDGAFGQSEDSLKVTLSNVDLSAIDALLLRPPQFAGRLNATSTISGSKDAPELQAQFQVNKGGFRQFHYDALTGTVKYGGRGATIDARLQQNPTTWLTANGYVPVAALRETPPGTNAAHVETAPREDRFDLHIDSSPIDLGIVQGFTTALNKVTGTLQAKVDVTGAASDPHPTGGITVQNAAFTVEPTGVSYTNFDGRIDLQRDRVHIERLGLVDNHKSVLSVTGDLAIHAAQVGAFNVAIKADDFKVIDNEMGNVRINSDLRIAGELRQPSVEGDLGISTGTINLDPILAQTGASAYATKQTEYATEAADNRGQTPPPTGFAALRMNVHVTVPDDLVVKGSDLKTPDAPIGLGAMNVTVGGDLRAMKDPGGQVRLVGTVNTVRGWYDFQGRRFDILRDGRVQFVGLEDLNPNLDIRTQRVIQGVEAHVDIRGTLRNPEIELSSIPPLEQADILSLIVFNQPINSVSETQQISLAQRAEGIAAGAVASQLAKSIGDALNLSDFEIQMAPENGAVAQFTLGQQITEGLYVKVQESVGDVNTTNFILEYELTKWLRLQTNLIQGSSTQQSLFQRAQSTGFDLLFFFSY